MKMEKKHNHKYLLLKALSEVAEETMDFATALICAGYGASLRDIEIARERASSRRFELKQRLDEERSAKKCFYKLISDMERSGLIEKNQPNGKKIISLTQLGKDKIKNGSIYKSSSSYAKEISKEPIIFVFDIPEKERRKRDWLRASLGHLGFHMVQKSVWIGSVKLPKVFLNDLGEQNLISRVEILSINKSGTIKNLL
jgi:DNA-binding transcriptional regulator PaaX